MRRQTEFAVTFYEGSPFHKGTVHNKMILPSPPAVGSLVKFQNNDTTFRVHAVVWMEFGEAYQIGVFVDNILT